MRKEDLKSWSRDALEDSLIQMYDKVFAIEQRLKDTEHEARQYKKELEELKNSQLHICIKESSLPFDDDFDAEELILEQQIEIEKLNSAIDVLLTRVKHNG